MVSIIPVLFAAMLAPVTPDAPVTARADTTVAGVRLPNTVEAGGQTLVLNGAALRKKAVFKVYVAGLYLPTKEKNAEKIIAADGPRRMIMHFVRNVGPEPICEAWTEGLAANTPNASAELTAQFKTLCDYMEGVDERDKLVFTYVPGTGTTVEVKGKTKGVIPGKEFADAMLRTWIGMKPGPGASFKRSVLGS